MLDQAMAELALLGGPTLPWSFTTLVAWHDLLAGARLWETLWWSGPTWS
jgi:hypothetical protein